MFLAAYTTDPRMLLTSILGAGVSTYGWLFFLEEAEIHTPPIFTDLVMRLRWEITHEQYKPGEKLPGTRELAQTHKLNRRSVGRALQILHEEGLIEKWPGRGWYIAGGHPNDKPRDSVEWHLLNTTRPGQSLPPTDELARLCGVSPSTIRRVINDLVNRGHFHYRGDRFYRNG